MNNKVAPARLSPKRSCFFLIIIFPYIIIGVNKTRQQPYSVPVLIAVSIPFDVAAAVIFAVRQNKKKPEEDHLPWQIILFRFCPRIAVATLIQPLLARIKQKT
ncbi:hypothetical protein IE981_17380 [Klebsiella pneumoniae]|nr:hypothetical protein [Klebsiella pneumoniae]